MNATVKRPAPRKDLSRVKRRRATPPEPSPPVIYPDINTMDIEQLLANLTGETLQDVSDCGKETKTNYYVEGDDVYQPPPAPAPRKTQVNYYVEDDDGAAKQVSRPPPPQPPAPRKTQVNYYVEDDDGAAKQVSRPLPPPPTPQAALDPRLLLRQIYKVATQADAVVGLDVLKDFKPSIYLVNNLATVELTFEDLLSLQSASVSKTVNRFFSEKVLFKPFYLHTVLVEARPNGLVALCNYQLKQKPVDHNINSVILSKPSDESDIVRQTSKVLLQSLGWSSLKRSFPSLESYFNILSECSPAVQFLITRYSRYFSKHYKVMTLLSANTTTDMASMTLDKQLVRHITNELPRLLQELNERRLPVETQDHWYEQTPLRTSMLPWIDCEVRRFCIPNITDSVLENLKYVARW